MNIKGGVTQNNSSIVEQLLLFLYPHWETLRETLGGTFVRVLDFRCLKNNIIGRSTKVLSLFTPF
jgi:hypothetical protein